MIQKITQAEIDRDAVAALADRPGEAARYGTGGLSAGQIKAHFDKLALLAIAKLNELIDALHGAGEDTLIDEVATHAASLLDEEARMPLSEWIASVESFLGLSGTGGLAARVAALEAWQAPEDEPLRGVHPDLVAGLAQNLCGRPNDETGILLTHRPTRDAGDVGKGNAVLRSIHGSTLVWNQIIQNGRFSGTSDWTGNAYGYSNISAADNVLTVSFGSGTYVNVKQTISVPAAHKVLISFEAKSAANDTTYTVRLTGATNAEASVAFSNAFGRYGVILTAPGSASYLSFFASATNGDRDFQLKNVFAVDLTRMFGVGQEPTTVAAFRALFPLNYYAYNAGALLNFNGTGLLTTGFNQWDEQWEAGTFDTATGVNAASTTQIRSKNLTGVLPDTYYYGTIPAGGMYAMFYDAGNNVIPLPANPGINANNVMLISNRVWKTPANARYMKFYATATYGATYQNDICINLSHSGWRNGEYEPYRERTLTLPVATYFPTGMKSVGSVFDELTATAAVQRIGTRAYAAGDESDATVVTDGTNTCYVLAEAVTTAVELDLIYRADDFGAEKLLPENGAAPTTSPLTGRVLYPLNAVDTVRNLPRNYVSLSTFDKLRAALAADYTVTRTWNAATNDYDVTATRVGGVWRHNVDLKRGDDKHAYFTVLMNTATPQATPPDGVYPAYAEDYGAGVMSVSSGVYTFRYGTSEETWNGSSGHIDTVTKLY